MQKIQKKIVFIGLSVLLIGGFFFLHHQHSEQVSTPTAVPVKVETPLQKSLAQTIKTTGYLSAKESTAITPLAAGYIRTIDFHEGQLVQKGDTLFQLDNEAQKNALASAQAAAQLSALQFERDKKLLARGFITQEMYYTAKVTDQQNQAALQTAQTNLAQRTITAPFAGTVGAISTSIGNYVTPGTAITTLVDNAHLRAEYTLPATNLAAITIGAPVTISTNTNNGNTTAAVTYIAPAIDESTQTIAVHARIDNTKNLFKPGEYITITQSLGSNNNTLLLPEQSVLASIDGYSVFIVQNNHAIRTPVKIGDRVDGNVVIVSGLSPKDLVITTGQNEVKNNQAIKLAT